MNKDALNKHAWVFAGGDYFWSELEAVSVEADDLIIGVDRGIEHCLASGLIPDIVLGDFDSVNTAILNDKRLNLAEVVGYDSRKNHSDLELALQCLAVQSVASVTLLCISGGRTDHHMFNWMLPFHKQWPYAIELIDSTVHAHLVSAQYPLNIPCLRSQTISLLPMPQASGVYTAGLEYPLVDATLTMGSTLGLSNVATACSIGVTVNEGRLMVLKIKAEQAHE